MQTKTKIGLGVLGIILVGSIIFLSTRKTKKKDDTIENKTLEELKNATEELSMYNKTLLDIKELLDNFSKKKNETEEKGKEITDKKITNKNKEETKKEDK